jgi:hypothetical protein
LVTPAKLRPGIPSANSGIAHKLLNAEGTAATASALYVRVIELESRTFDRFDVIDLHTFQIHFAHLVDEDFQAFKLVHVIAGFVDLIFKSHVIAEARAASANHGDPQTSR